MASNDLTKPNVIFILSDDQGPWAMGCAGNKEIVTPNLDSLADTGMRFENFFCASPVCSPARASLLTGRIPSQHGVLDWIAKGNINDPDGKYRGKDRPIEYLQGLKGYTDILADEGYTCGFSGKWHLGASEQPQKGFSHWFTHGYGGGNYYEYEMVRDGKIYTENRYVTDVITDDAIQFIKGQQDSEKPFYLSVHYTAPHSPWIDNHPKEIVDSYDDCPFESCPQEPKHPWASGLTESAMKDPRENLKGYFAAVTAMDLNIGRILETLDQLDLRKNTMIVFSSDNGFSCGHHGFWGKGNGTIPQNMFENSVKVPTIFNQPGVIPDGQVCDALVSGYDFFPTLLDYLGMENPEKDQLPGTSFSRLLRGESQPTREDIVIFDEYGPVRMIRTENWKYVHRYPYGPHELYDMVNDPDERHNQVNNPDRNGVIKEMKARLEEWFHKYADPARDGRGEAVTGGGQWELAGPAGKGERAFGGKFKISYEWDKE